MADTFEAVKKLGFPQVNNKLQLAPGISLGLEGEDDLFVQLECSGGAVRHFADFSTVEFDGVIIPVRTGFGEDVVLRCTPSLVPQLLACPYFTGLRHKGQPAANGKVLYVGKINCSELRVETEVVPILKYFKYNGFVL